MSAILPGPVAVLAIAAGLATQHPAPPEESLVLWLRADAGVRLDGERVVLWEDQSAGRHHAEGEPGTAPLLTANAIGNLPAVRFDGQHSHLIVPHHEDLNAGDAFTVFCVYRFSGGFRIAQKKSDAVGLSTDAWFLAPVSGLGVSGKYVGELAFARNQAHLQSSVFDGGAGTLGVYRYGELLAEMTGLVPQQPNADPVYLGQRNSPAGTQGHLKGDIAELLIYGTALPDEPRATVEAYLTAKYALSPPEQPTLTITRVIPGQHQVTVDWRRPEAASPDAKLRYEIAAKLRESSWDEAVTKAIPGDRTSGKVGGLLNHADYELRVTALRAANGEPVGVSADRLVTPGPVPGVVIDYLHKDDPAYADYGQYVGSPTIAKLDDGTLVAGHDLFGPGTSDFSRIFRSEDGGETWRHAADVRPAFWGKLFVHRGMLYLLACRTLNSDLLLYQSPDGGMTWPEPVVIAPGRYHRAPVPVQVHEGRLWTCVEAQTTGGWPSGEPAVALSAPADADLMDPDNWTVSEPLPYDPAWLPVGWEVPAERQCYLEGNVVVDPEGNLLNILRLNAKPYYGQAIVLRIADDGKSLSFDRAIDFDGGATKFTIRRHPDTGIYWSLVNRVTKPNAAGMRSVLSLVWSEDLNEWHPVRDILRDDREIAVRYTGFQYVDWLFDGPDIIAAARTAYNGAHSYHDANHLTFHRVRNFAEDIPWEAP